MSPIIRYKNDAVEFHCATVTDNTVFTLTRTPGKYGVFIRQNGELLTFITMPIMKVVRALRTLYPNVTLEVE